MPRPSDNPNYAYEVAECSILHAWREYWSMNDKERSDLIEHLALCEQPDAHLPRE
ncbi:hypothetical protein ACVWXO_009896 [Bradyrhizobium sp. LM2.7]